MNNKRAMSGGRVRKFYDLIPAVKQAGFRNGVIADKDFTPKAFYNLINREDENICAADRRILVANFRKVGMSSPFVKRRKNNAKSTDKKRVRDCSDASLDRAQ